MRPPLAVPGVVSRALRAARQPRRFRHAPAAEILAYAGAEAAVGAAWMTLALLTFNRLAAQGRLDGSLDYGA
jgi:hypothetical protein